MYVILYVRLDICFTVGIVSRSKIRGLGRCQSYAHKYLRRMEEYMLVSLCSESVLLRYQELDF